MKKIPFLAPQNDEDGAFAFVVLVRWAGGDTWSAYSVHRDEGEALSVARAQSGEVTRVCYYDGVPRDPEEYPEPSIPETVRIEGGVS